MERRYPQPQHEHEASDDDCHRRRVAHHHHHAPSPVAHYTRTLGALIPLVITELIPEDHVKQIRFIRIASVALAVLNEGSYAYRVNQERREREYENQRY